LKDNDMTGGKSKAGDGDGNPRPRYSPCHDS
jgi:hypothetical protein